MPHVNQDLILPGESQYLLKTDTALNKWAAMFDPKNPTGIAAALNLGDAISSGRTPAYILSDEGTLSPINPTDLPKNGKFSDMTDSPCAQAYTAAFNNRLFVPTAEGKLVQVNAENPFKDLDYSLSKPFDISDNFPAPKRPSIWKRIFSFFFGDEIREYEQKAEMFRSLASRGSLESFMSAAESGRQIQAPSEARASNAPSKNETLDQFRARLNQIAFSDVDWAMEAMGKEDRSFTSYCDGVAKNLERIAAQNLLKRAQADPQNADAILAKNQKPFNTLLRGLMVFTRNDIDPLEVMDVINGDGLKDPGYPEVHNMQINYTRTALGRYNRQLAQEFEGRASILEQPQADQSQLENEQQLPTFQKEPPKGPVLH